MQFYRFSKVPEKVVRVGQRARERSLRFCQWCCEDQRLVRFLAKVEQSPNVTAVWSIALLMMASFIMGYPLLPVKDSKKTKEIITGEASPAEAEAESTPQASQPQVNASSVAPVPQRVLPAPMENVASTTTGERELSEPSGRRRLFDGKILRRVASHRDTIDRLLDWFDAATQDGEIVSSDEARRQDSGNQTM